MKRVLALFALACVAAFAGDTGGVNDGDQTWGGHKQLGEMANVAAKGIPISRSGTTAAWRVYSDDNGQALNGTGSVPDLRGSLSRFLVTTSQTGGHVRLHADMGQLKAYNAGWNTEQAAGVYGLVELVRDAGTTTFGGYGNTAALMGCVSTSGVITIDTNHILAGVAAISKLTSTVVQTGKTVGLLVDTYDTTNWSDGTARTKWGYGIYMPRGGVTQGLRIGDWVAAGAAGSAILIDTNLNNYADGQLSVADIFGESTAALTSAYASKVLRVRHIATASVDQETYGVMGQMVGKGTTMSHLHAGVIGTFEGQAGTVSNGAYAYSCAAVMARVGGGGSITATKPVSGFSSVLNGAVMASGSCAAFAACATSTGNWTYLLAADHCDNLFYAATGTNYENGVKVTAISGIDDASSAVARVYIGGTAYYIPLYAAAEVDGE
jgi:hypothetical protein